MNRKKLPINESRSIERLSGVLTLIIAFLAVASIVTSIDLVPDYLGLHEDVEYLGENLQRLSLNTYLWLINAVCIILLGPMVLITFLPHGRSIPYICAFLIAATGIIYLFYAIQGFTLIHYARDFKLVSGKPADQLAYFTLNAVIARQKLQLTAFTTAGACAVLIGIYLILKRRLPALLGWFILIGGLIYSVFGWFGMENIIFSAGRLGFILSLIIFGGYLLLSGVKKDDQ